MSQYLREAISINLKELTMFDERPVTNPEARLVLEILSAGGYQAPSGNWISIREEQRAAETNTRLYTPEDLEALRNRRGKTGNNLRLEVLDATTQAAAQNLSDEGAVVLLNFASARNPGGGFLGGAKAQEEELCRCSGLYRTLVTQSTYYTVNRNQRSLLYTDHLIYSPQVPFFRLNTKSKFLDNPWLASVITTPAPNAGALLKREPSALASIRPTYERRWANILAVAEDNGHRLILLGAWGCGAFRNEPMVAAETARTVLMSPRFVGSFERVVFAVPNIGNRSQANLAAFRKVLCEYN